MRIAHVRIHNFCSIKDLELDLQQFSVLIGPNNHGKSNILRAIEFALNPTQKLPPNRRFHHCESQDDGDVWVEITFTQLTRTELEQLAEYIVGGDRFTFRKTVKFQDGVPQAPECCGYVEEFEDWYLQPGGYERLSSKEKAAKERDEASNDELRAFLADGQRKLKGEFEEFRRNFIASHRSTLEGEVKLSATPIPTTKGGPLACLPEFHFVPAVKDAMDEVKPKGSSPFGRLMQGAIKDLSPSFAATQAQLDDLIASMNPGNDQTKGGEHPLGRVESAIAAVMQDWDVSPRILIKTPDIAEIIEQNIQFLLGDGVETEIENKGHGLQRAMIMAILQVWVSVSKIPPVNNENGNPGAEGDRRSVLFLIEEPELYLHPQAQRRLATSLHQLSDLSEHQVIVCTHSPSFISLEEYRSIAIVSKDSSITGTYVRQCGTDIFAGHTHAERKNQFNLAYWINPHRAELFFARKVVLVEGPTEGVLFPFLAKRLAFNIEDVCIIDCGGKGNIETYMRLLNAFRIPYVVVHDEDPLPNPLPADEQKRRSVQRTFAMNQTFRELCDPACGSIYMFSPDLEKASGVSKTQGENLGKPLAAINHFSQKIEIPTKLREAVELAYGTSASAAQVATQKLQAAEAEASVTGSEAPVISPVISIEAPVIAVEAPVLGMGSPVTGT